MPKKPKRRRSRPTRSYAWALHFPPTDRRVLRLSRLGQDGLDYARKLARNALLRKERAISGLAPDRLTANQIAKDEELSPPQVYTAIRQAKIELFGRDLSESAIRHRLRREKEIATRPVRTCAEEWCAQPLPRAATGRRRFCDLHVAPAARVRRHRAKAASGS
jgi:hypothetical protein